MPAESGNRTDIDMSDVVNIKMINSEYHVSSPTGSRSLSENVSLNFLYTICSVQS
jgi:hypothetical protein